MGFLVNDSYDAARNIAGQASGNYNELGKQLGSQANYLRGVASGKNSISAEQLRQGLQQNLAGQRSMAASASPQNSTMATVMASRNAMTAGAGLAGQQAIAGIQERAAAQDALTRMLLEQRQQEANREAEARRTLATEPSWWDKYGGAAIGVGKLAVGAL